MITQWIVDTCATAPITAHGIAYAIELLNRQMPYYQFVPDASAEGGLCMANWPGRPSNNYMCKVLRIHWDDSQSNWPEIDRSVNMAHQWLDHPDFTIWDVVPVYTSYSPPEMQCERRGTLYFKYSTGDVPWAIFEVQHTLDALAELGVNTF
jgi:hypothetical protein